MENYPEWYRLARVVNISANTVEQDLIRDVGIKSIGKDLVEVELLSLSTLSLSNLAYVADRKGIKYMWMVDQAWARHEERKQFWQKSKLNLSDFELGKWREFRSECLVIDTWHLISIIIIIILFPIKLNCISPVLQVIRSVKKMCL